MSRTVASIEGKHLKHISCPGGGSKLCLEAFRASSGLDSTCAHRSANATLCLVAHIPCMFKTNEVNKIRPEIRGKYYHHEDNPSPLRRSPCGLAHGLHLYVEQPLVSR